MNKIPVALVVNSLELGGMERVVVHLATHFSAEFLPIVFCLAIKGPMAEELEKTGIEVIALGKKPGKDLLLPRRLAQLFRERNIRIMHAHNSGPMFTGTWAAKIAGVKGIMVTDHSRALPERPSVIATEYVLSRIADILVSVSESNKRDLIEQLYWPANKIIVVPNGVAEASKLTPEKRQALRMEMGVHDDVPACLTVARMEKQKNLVLLVQAAKLLKNRGMTFRVLIAGDGSERSTVEKAIADCGVGDVVRLLGWRLDALQLYSAADLAVMSSDWEGLPMFVLEAMSARLPVVSTAVGDIGKAVISGENGLLTPPRSPEQLAAALAELLVNPSRRTQFGEAGYRSWRERYSVENMVRRYEELYRSIG